MQELISNGNCNSKVVSNLSSIYSYNYISDKIFIQLQVEWLYLLCWNFYELCLELRTFSIKPDMFFQIITDQFHKKTEYLTSHQCPLT